ncbi:hypothetical protein SAMN04487770_12024 [Butyrivibrio sp. ob235]|uniref:hypothetical protein n=1 Tax=Butyrivibrio sp. ob235 TaxID=1761780 RepID=UPI0008D5171B|nr:hypothetical protein [Butyrivibrio sp. ob235]SEL89592.1 hypothetical protein SAMN04487770_12024 [Butyrivibrio sp. ob235]
MKKKSFPKNIRASRIQTLIDRENITRKELALSMINAKGNPIDPQNLSRAMSDDNEKDVSEKYCRMIQKAYPEYRIDWLLGDSEYMTYSDEFINKVNFEDIIADSMWAIIEKSLKKNGMSLKFVHKNNGMHVDSFTRRFVDCWYEIKDNQDKLVLKMDSKEMISLEEEIQDFVDFILFKRLNITK